MKYLNNKHLKLKMSTEIKENEQQAISAFK
jgi:hypothetical protein